VNFLWDSITSKISSAAQKFCTVIFGSSESEDSRWLRIIVLVGVLTVALLVVAGLSAFFLTLRGEEQTMVPDIRRAELVDALIRLQEKDLYPQVQMRFSSDPSLKGKVIDQQPAAGSVVKAGKRVTIVVSQGSVVDKVENFAGKNLDDVRTHIQTLFATYKPLLRIKEPVTYVFDKEPAGTILEQQPAAGTDLTELTDLTLIVSRGPETSVIKLISYVGIDFNQAIPILAKANIPFFFTVAEPNPGQTRQFAIVSQTPPPGTTAGDNLRLELAIAPPAKTPGELVFGLFQCTLPKYPVWVDMKFEAVNISGDRTTIFTMKHPGGPVSIPYYREANTTLILSIFNQEVYRDTVVAN
jgi:beta-lactam-binding protein with PASTA domain